MQTWQVTSSGLSLVFQVDGELKKVAGGQKKSSAAAELAGGGVDGYSGGWGFRKIHKFFLKRFLMQCLHGVN